MFARVGLLWMVVWSPGVFGRMGAASNSTGTLLYEKRGDVSLAGVFGRRSGEECSEVEVGRGLEEIISAIWTIEALNAYEYLPGVTIGLSVFDVCEPLNDRTAARKMAEELSHLGEETANIGIITTPEISGKLAGKFPGSGIVVPIKHIVGDDMLIGIAIQLLVNLQWMNVSAAIFDSASPLKGFEKRASEEGITLGENVLMNCSSSCPELVSFPEEVDQSVIVMIATFANIARFAEKFGRKNVRLILAPTDFLFEFSLIDLPKNAIVCLPSMQDKRALSGHLVNILQRKENFFTPKSPVKGPLFVGTAATILRLLKPLRTALQEGCREGSSPPEESCNPVAHLTGDIKGNKTRSRVHETTEISPDDVGEALKVLKIEPSFNDEMFLCIASVVNANTSEDVAIFQVFNPELKTLRPVPIMINDHRLNSDAEGGGVGRRAGEDVPAKSRRKDLRESLLQEEGEGAMAGANGTWDGVPEVRWRSLAWVSANTCVGSVGVTCTLSIILFVVTKMCKDGFLEGSPYFMLVLMVCVVLTYLSSLPFHVELAEEGLICGYRKCAPPVVFAVLFSLLLSRSVMVAFSESGEGSGHINGYLQSVLSVFMIGVQASITTQNWVFAKGRHDLACGNTHDKYGVILPLVYDFLLLILLACVSPFIVRSKRNCKEGLLFSISVFFITVVWSAWISFYVLLPNEHKDAAVALGLNSTASVLLLCLFIPQMYFMAAPFSHDRTIRAHSSLDTDVLPPASRPDFKSCLALNDCTFGSYKTTHAGFVTGRPTGSSNPGGTDAFVDECAPPGTPDPVQPN